MFKQLAYSFCLFAALAALPGMVQAQSVPTANIDYTSHIGSLLTTMVDQDIGLMLDDGLIMLHGIAVIMLVYYCLTGMFGDISSLMQRIFELLFMYSIFYTMLQFYDSPMPFFGGTSFHSIFAEEGVWAAAKFDTGAINKVIATLLDIMKHLPKPSLSDLYGLLLLPFFWIAISVAWVMATGVTLVAHLALGLGALVGPLLIPFGIWPFMSGLFNSWLRFMITYTLYLITASAISYLFTNSLMWFIQTAVRGDYSSPHLLSVAMPFLALLITFAFAFWQSHTWARDIAHGSASAGGAGLATVAQTAVSFVLRK